MDYIIVSLLAGVCSGLISIWFRLYEIGTEKILVGTQFLFQMFIFGIFSYSFYLFFSEYYLQIGTIVINWFILFFVLSSLSYYAVQTVFEWKSRIPLFPTEKEIEEYLEKNIQ